MSLTNSSRNQDCGNVAGCSINIPSQKGQSILISNCDLLPGTVHHPAKYQANSWLHMAILKSHLHHGTMHDPSKFVGQVTVATLCLRLAPSSSWQIMKFHGNMAKLGKVRHFNSLRPSDIYMHQYNIPTLLQIMAFCLFGTKPLSEPKLPYCQLEESTETATS